MNIGAREMPKHELRFNDDIALVAGLKTTDSLLIIGDNVKFPGIQLGVANITYVSSAKELTNVLREGYVFDRVFIARENAIDERVILAATALSKSLICFFSEEEELRNSFCNAIETNFPTADIWPLVSNVGHLVATNARV